MHVKGIWKLHGIDSVTGKSRSANNATFYNSYEEALAAAQSYVGRDNKPCPGIVIFKAYSLVMPVPPVKPSVVVVEFDDHFVPDTVDTDRV